MVSQAVSWLAACGPEPPPESQIVIESLPCRGAVCSADGSDDGIMQYSLLGFRRLDPETSPEGEAWRLSAVAMAFAMAI